MDLMKIRLVFLSILMAYYAPVLISQSIYSPTIEPGKEWRIGVGTGMGNYLELSWVVSCDTVEYNGLKYSVIEPTWISTPNYCSDTLYVREDTMERKVYYLPEPYEGQEEILYIDYNLEQGDTVQIYPHWQNTVVDTVRYIDFLDETVRFIDFGCSPGPCDGFVEGFGLYRSGSLPGCSGWTMPYSLDIIFDCNEVNDVDEVSQSDAFVVYPNPASEHLNISINDPATPFPVHLELRAADGSFLRQFIITNIHSVIDLEGLPQGILILKLGFNTKVFVERIIKY